jgi:hypothetical protein
MMSLWDFQHLTGGAGLLDASAEERQKKFESFSRHWITTGGLFYPFAAPWLVNARSWIEQRELPVLVVGYSRLRAQPAAELARILKFLGREASQERIARAAEAGRADNMRKLENDEVAAGQAGIFYRPELAKGYAKGHRFVGKLHEGSASKVLNAEARTYVEKAFGPTRSRLLELATVR